MILLFILASRKVCSSLLLMVILLFILASRKVCVFIAVDDIVVHPGIQESVFCFFVVVDDDIVVHAGIQESLLCSCC